MEDQLFSSQNSDLKNDLAMCIDTNDNEMAFVGHIVYICPLWHHSHPPNNATRATNKLYAIQKSFDCPINLSLEKGEAKQKAGRNGLNN